MILLIILVYAVIGFFEISALIKQQKMKEIILYSFVFLSAFVLSILINLGVQIPSPAKPIENTVKIIKGIFW
jgi:hypothetical protein